MLSYEEKAGLFGGSGDHSHNNLQNSRKLITYWSMSRPRRWSTRWLTRQQRGKPRTLGDIVIDVEATALVHAVVDTISQAEGESFSERRVEVKVYARVATLAER